MRSLSTNSNKKAQVSSLAPAILALVFAAIVLVMGIILTQELRDVDTLKSNKNVVNETDTIIEGAWVNATGYTVKVEAGGKTDTFVLTTIWNHDETSGLWSNTTALANATIDPTSGLVTNTTDTAGTYNNVSLSYSYQTGGDAWIAGNSTVEGLGTFADFWEIIVLAIVITIVIGMLLAAFGGRKVGR